MEFVLKNQMLNINCTIEIKRFVLIFTVHFSKLTFCSWRDIMAIPHKEQSGDFARHLLANFPSYFTKMLVNTSSIHSAFCFI